MIETGEIAGKYEVLGIVDKPKAGVTYKVRNRETGELEVLRALPGAAYGDPEAQERFLREIRIHTRLSHPNIVAFHDAFELDGQLVMTAEYVDGATLAQLVREGRIKSTAAVRAICDVLAGLEEAEALGIVHRAITAEHVTVMADGRAKLGGFGLAKPASDEKLTQAGAVLGDARYISPEQVIGKTLDARSDIYSVGVLLYLALTGRVPFDGNEFDVMVAQVGNEPAQPSSINPAIPPDMERVILTALAKKPEQRFSSAREFRDALMAVETPRAVTRIAAPEPEIAFRIAPLPQAHRFPVVAGVICAALVLVIVVLVAMH